MTKILHKVKYNENYYFTENNFLRDFPLEIIKFESFDEEISPTNKIITY